MPDETEAHFPILSPEESIQRLKAEIIAQDWRLPEKRATLLTAALHALKGSFNNRKAAFAVLIMASNILRYLQKMNGQQVAGTVDFLKEALAHIVTFYEAPMRDLVQEKKICNMLYRRFNQLKEKIQASQQGAAKQKTRPA